MRKLKYILNEFRWMKILFSPFKPFTVKFYAGKTAVGVPYFYPRKWVKSKTKPGYTEPVPLKIGFSHCGLGWKTKWSDTDFRYEYGPVFSFVFFGYQIALMVGHKDVDHYWEAWLYYEHATDKAKSKHDRIKQCIKNCPQTYTSYWADNSKVTINYYNRILRKKYLKHII